MSVADQRRRAVAKERARREERKAQGLCIECAGRLPLSAKFATCDSCRAGNRAVYAAKKCEVPA